MLCIMKISDNLESFAVSNLNALAMIFYLFFLIMAHRVSCKFIE